MINSSSNDITWSKRKTFIILLHKFLPIGKPQHSTITTHSLSNQKCWMCLRRIIKNRGMKLYKLHVLDCSLSSIDHCDTIASSYNGVGGHCVDSTHTTSCHKCYLTQKSINLLGIRIENIRTITFNIWSSTRYLYPHVMLCNNLNSIMIFKDSNIRISPHSLHQSTLYLKACVISMMKNTKITMASFTM